MRSATYLGRRGIMLAALCAAALGSVSQAMADYVISFQGPATVNSGAAQVLYTVDVLINGPDGTDNATFNPLLANTAGTNTAGVVFRGPPSNQAVSFTASSWGGAAAWAALTLNNNPNAGGGANRRLVFNGLFPIITGGNPPTVPGPNQFVATLNIIIPANSAAGTYTLTMGSATDFAASDGTVPNFSTTPFSFTIVPVVVPEPSSIVLSAVGLVGGLGVWVARRRSSKKEEVTVAA